MEESEKPNLSHALAAGRAAWPGVNLSKRDLAAFLAIGDIAADAVRQNGADLFLAAGCEAMIPHHAQHVVFVGGIEWEGPLFLGYHC